MTMRATCQVAHATNGRIRLRVAEIRSRPQIGPLLVAFLGALPGVTGVLVRAAGATVVVSYDPANARRSRSYRRFGSDRLRSRTTQAMQLAAHRPGSNQRPTTPFPTPRAPSSTRFEDVCA